jgi:cell division protein FtsI/penicillin-binding protein 2
MLEAQNNTPKKTVSANTRILIWYGALLLVAAVFIWRLFYLQIIRHDYYQKLAFADQLKEYKITAPRGLIKAHDGSETVPIVLNESLYTLYVDPTFAKKEASDDAQKLAAITGGEVNTYENLIKTPNTRYVILQKRLTQAQKDKILALKLPGVGLQEQNYRNYPQGSLASQATWICK